MSNSGAYSTVVTLNRLKANWSMHAIQHHISYLLRHKIELAYLPEIVASGYNRYWCHRPPREDSHKNLPLLFLCTIPT